MGILSWFRKKAVALDRIREERSEVQVEEQALEMSIIDLVSRGKGEATLSGDTAIFVYGGIVFRVHEEHQNYQYRGKLQADKEGAWSWTSTNEFRAFPGAVRLRCLQKFSKSKGVITANGIQAAMSSLGDDDA